MSHCSEGWMISIDVRRLNEKSHGQHFLLQRLINPLRKISQHFIECSLWAGDMGNLVPHGQPAPQLRFFLAASSLSRYAFFEGSGSRREKFV